ncbi:TetR/AcrR family transcriptional regulator [Caldimonas tepidiphila]|uniref:TetR/AcrR family transcriptional regulator n=1 Tax=Caldimonas tepidiphila TaxID=2315841 RepID=UPI001F0B9AC4|nr:TetR/AcrR family transcriptional regulator [Caldimonas tepidiphila]
MDGSTAPPPTIAPHLHRARILDIALELGELRGWDAVHLHDVARAMGVTLSDIHRHYLQKDALAEAWFDRADRALLEACEAPGWGALDVRERLHGALFAWLDALAPHRRLTSEMLRYKLQPEHLHLQALGALRVSRTVQWWREAAWLPSTGWRRELEEAALTVTYLSTFASWLRDETRGAERTRARLHRQLTVAEWAAVRLAFRR